MASDWPAHPQGQKRLSHKGRMWQSVPKGHLFKGASLGGQRQALVRRHSREGEDFEEMKIGHVF